MKGLLVINKSKGVSSSNVVVKIKKLLQTKKVGHMGTLDPLASGVLLVGVGKATRLFDEFLNKQKTYQATFKFGEQTDTLDLEGNIVKTSTVIPTQKQIEDVLPKFIGVQNQLPPEYSSKKINGVRAYNLVRQGKEVNLKPNKIEIYSISLIKAINKNTFVFNIVCSSGTYIRSIARDLGLALNSCATMVDLIRTKCGNFCLEEAIDLTAETENTLKNKILPLNKVLENFAKIELTNGQLTNLLNGKNVVINGLDASKKYCVYFNNEVVGIGKIDENNNLKITTFLYN